MKRFFTIIIVAVMLSVSACADGIDLESLTLSELLSLHEQLDAAIENECRVDMNNIYQGVYIVGEDISSGYYLFTCIEDRYGEDSLDFFYELYETKEAYDKYNRSMYDRFNFGESVQIKLTDGMVLRIVYGTANIQLSSKPAWAP